MTQAELTPCFFTGEQIADFQLIRLLRVHRLAESWYALRRENAAPIAVKFLRKENPGIPKFCRIAHFLRDNHSPFLNAAKPSGRYRMRRWNMRTAGLCAVFWQNTENFHLPMPFICFGGV